MEMTLSSPFERIFSPKEINTQKNSLNLNYELSIQIKEEKKFFLGCYAILHISLLEVKES